MPQTPEVEQFLRSIGPFYEEVHDDDTDTDVASDLHDEATVAAEASLASGVGEEGAGGENSTTQDLDYRGEGGGGEGAESEGGEEAEGSTEFDKDSEDGGDDVAILTTSPPVERSGSVEGLCE